MRLVYTADLHGNLQSYMQLLALAGQVGARAAVVGGDLFPHAIRSAQAAELQRRFLHEQLRPLLFTIRAAHPDLAVFLLPGNDDWALAAEDVAILQREQLAYALHERVYDLMALGLSAAPLWLAGYACVPLTPFSIKDYERRDDGPLPPYSFELAYTSWSGQVEKTSAQAIAALPSIAEALALLAAQSAPAQTVYVCHTPPHDTPLDAMPRGRHPGSRALRTFIETHQPLLTLHGHIHEAPQISGQYAMRLGNTWSANPGHDPHYFSAITLDTNDIGTTIEHTVFGGNQQPAADS
ncbi:MAG: metallophosphoesterase [Roseiflexaceae bacterium]|nr:metallophosphoesterase [Roseiflexaceae bacterium]